MSSIGKIKFVGILSTLAIFWLVAAPFCAVASNLPVITNRSLRPGMKILSGPHGPEGTIRKAVVAHQRPARDHRSPKGARKRGRAYNHGQASGPFLSRLEVKEVLVRAGFPAQAIPTMLRIANCESSLSATAENVNRDGSVDMGLFQINERNWEACSVSKAELADPEGNARCAYQVWQQQGYGAWGCCERA